MPIITDDHTGKVYGDLTAIRKADKRTYWVFSCKCGGIHERDIYRVVSQKLDTCPKKEKSLRTKFKDSHQTWYGAISRCTNPNSHAYRDYGARGISVCDRWLTSFDNFLADMGSRPEGLSLDRIDVNGDYSPDNCRWVTMAEQNRNKQYHRIVAYAGVTKPLFQWVADLKLNYYTVHSRLYKGWTVEEALFGTRPRKTKGNLRYARHREDILSIMVKGVEYNRDDLMAATGKDRETTREALMRMVSDGIVECRRGRCTQQGGTPTKFWRVK